MGETKVKIILLRVGELFLKGENRYIFESTLMHNIRVKLDGLKFKLERTQGRLIVSNFEDEDEIVERLSKVFGLSSLSVADEVEASQIAIENYFSKILGVDGTFKVDVNRGDKRFPLTSMQLEAQLGGIILDRNPNATVDLYNPSYVIKVDIRQNGKAYIFDKVIKGQGGLPLGTSGRALLLLSGGIDSPVAGYLMAKRGLKLEALHFHSYPYTSPEAKQKVVTLAKKLTVYTDEIKLHCISFTKVQEAIHANCSPEFMITIMRRIMMRIAEIISKRDELGAIVTGESLGQVASQTMQSMTVTEGVVKSLPMFRPCLAMDKEEIVKISKEIDCFETSILPYEDCCTVFLPKNPVIKPKMKRVLDEEAHLDIDGLIEEALSSEEVIVIKNEQ